MDKNLRDLCESYYQIYSEQDNSFDRGERIRRGLSQAASAGAQNKPLPKGASIGDRLVHGYASGADAQVKGLRGETLPSNDTWLRRFENWRGRLQRGAVRGAAGLVGAPDPAQALNALPAGSDKARVGFLTKNGVRGWQGPDGKWSPLGGSTTPQKDNSSTPEKSPSAAAKTDTDTSDQQSSSASSTTSPSAAEKTPPASSSTSSTSSTSSSPTSSLTASSPAFNPPPRQNTAKYTVQLPAPASKQQQDANYQAWARANKDLAKNVKPGQAGYDAIQSVINKESYAPITMRDLISSYYDIYEKLDPVGKEDEDVDNDGDSDESDEYIKNKRKKIGDAMKKKSKHHDEDEEDDDEDDDEMNEETKSERYARLHASEMKGRKRAASREGRITKAGEDLLRDIMDTNRALRNAQKPMSNVTRSVSRSEAPEANRKLDAGMRKDTLAARASKAMREDTDMILVVAKFLLENEVVDTPNAALEMATNMDDVWFREILLTEALNEDI